MKTSFSFPIHKLLLLGLLSSPSVRAANHTAEPGSQNSTEATSSLRQRRLASCEGSPQYSNCQSASSTQNGCNNLFQGCSWDSGSNTCRGTMKQCYEFGSEGQCYSQPGCYWRTPFGPSQPAPSDVSGCFSGDTTVQVQTSNGQPPATKKMKDLRVGDAVLTNSKTNAFQPVYAFGHSDPVNQIEFVKLSFGGDGNKQQSIELTPDHMIYLHTKSAPVRADNVRVGDFLIQGGSPSEVTHISTLSKKGMYAPLTAEGTIVVNDVLASTYVALGKLSDTADIKVNGVTLPFLNQHSCIHLAISPLRMACSLTGSSLGLCLGESDNLDGINPYVAWGMDTIRLGEQQAPLVQVFLLYVSATIFLVISLLEGALFGVGAAPVLLVRLVLSLAFAAFVTRGRSSKKGKLA